MKRYFFSFLFCIISLLASGQVIGDFTLTDLRNSNTVSLSDFGSKKAVVVIFTSINCPYDEYYHNRMMEFAAEYQNKDVGVLFINSVPSETGEEIKAHATGWNAPYLSDKQQVVMKLLGASKTPESIILIPVNGGFRKIYQGAIDNNPQVEADVKKPFLRRNLEDVLSGEPLTYADVLPVGCRIRTP